MGVQYHAFFDVRDVTGTITLRTAGETDIVITLSSVRGLDEDGENSAIFNHYHHTGLAGSDPAATQRYRHFARTSLGVRLQQLIRDQMTTLGWSLPSFFFCLLSTSGLYSFVWPVANFEVEFSDDNAALIMGFDPGALSLPPVLTGAQSYTGTRAPYYSIISTMQDVSFEECFTEPDGIANAPITDEGSAHTLSRYSAPQFKDWVQQYETRDRTFRLADGYQILTTSPFSHQHLYEHCRTKSMPFLLWGEHREGGTNGVAQLCRLRSDGLSFQPKRAAPGHGDMFNIPYRVVYEGLVE